MQHEQFCKIAETWAPDTVEGNVQGVPKQREFLKEIVSRPEIKTVVEIGFNSGHSASWFLANNPSVSVHSFDIGNWRCVTKGKAVIDALYPNRHSLILGDSCRTVPEFSRANPDKKFDLIFIDGGHMYDVAQADVRNCFSLAHKDSIVVMDDIVRRGDWLAQWNYGPALAWADGVREGIIKEEGQADYSEGRGHAWGKYVIPDTE